MNLKWKTFGCIPCSLPHVSLWGASLKETSLLFCPSLILSRKAAVIFLAESKLTLLPPLGPHLYLSFFGLIMFRTHRSWLTHRQGPQAAVQVLLSCDTDTVCWEDLHSHPLKPQPPVLLFFWNIADFFLLSSWQISRSISTISRERKECCLLLLPLPHEQMGNCIFKEKPSEF